MDLREARVIIRELADGFDPITGEAFPASSPYQHPQVVRALHAVLRHLDLPAPREHGEDGAPANAGQPWTPGEDGLLVDEFDSGCSVATIAGRHGRTLGAIRSRLLRHGREESERVQGADSRGRDDRSDDISTAARRPHAPVAQGSSPVG